MVVARRQHCRCIPSSKCQDRIDVRLDHSSNTDEAPADRHCGDRSLGLTNIRRHFPTFAGYPLTVGRELACRLYQGRSPGGGLRLQGYLA